MEKEWKSYNVASPYRHLLNTALFLLKKKESQLSITYISSSQAYPIMVAPTYVPG